MSKRSMSILILIVIAAAGWLAPDGRSADRRSKPTGKVRVSDVILTGSKRMTAEQIKARLRTQPGKEYDEATLNDDVRRLYTTGQFSNILTYVEEDGPGRCKVYFAFRDLANTVQKVTFEGAKHIKPEELRELTGVRPGMPLSTNRNRQACFVIQQQYEEMGRPLAVCSLVTGGDWHDTEVVFQIVEGPKVALHEVQFTGNTYASAKKLVGLIPPRAGERYDGDKAEAGRCELACFYRRAGFRDAEVSLETRRDLHARQIDLVYHIQEGPRYRVSGEPEVIAPKNFPSGQLQRLVKVKKGDYLTDKALHSDQHHIKAFCEALHYCVRVEAIPIWLFRQPGLAELQYQVEEIRPRIGKISVVGNEHLSAESILAHVALQPGRVLTYPALQQAEKTLSALGLFVVDPAAGVRPTITVVDSDGDDEHKDLLIKVKEKQK